jgi:quercetin dioxygenase-like cupin family protein
MALAHATSGQPVDVRPLGSQFVVTRTHALFKSVELEVIRLVLPKGKSMPSHAVRGEVTVQCVEGRITLATGHTSQVLEAGQLLFLAGGVTHSLVGLEDATALVTIVLQNG